MCNKVIDLKSSKLLTGISLFDPPIEISSLRLRLACCTYLKVAVLFVAPQTTSIDRNEVCHSTYCSGTNALKLQTQHKCCFTWTFLSTSVSVVYPTIGIPRGWAT